MTKTKTDENTKTPNPREIPVQRMQSTDREEGKINRYFLRAPAEATVEDLSRREYWKNCANMLSRHDVVTILADDEEWQAECIVENSTKDQGADVTVARVIERKGIKDTAIPLDDGHYLQHRAGAGYCVCRASDHYAIAKGFSTEEAARYHHYQNTPRIVDAMGAA